MSTDFQDPAAHPPGDRLGPTLVQTRTIHGLIPKLRIERQTLVSAGFWAFRLVAGLRPSGLLIRWL